MRGLGTRMKITVRSTLVGPSTSKQHELSITHLERNHVVGALFAREIHIAKLATPKRLANVKVGQLPASLICRCLQTPAQNTQ